MSYRLDPSTILLLSQLVLIFILYQTSKPARQLIFAQGRKAVIWTINQARHRRPARPISLLKPHGSGTK